MAERNVYSSSTTARKSQIRASLNTRIYENNDLIEPGTREQLGDCVLRGAETPESVTFEALQIGDGEAGVM